MKKVKREDLFEFMAHGEYHAFWKKDLKTLFDAWYKHKINVENIPQTPVPRKRKRN